jgi:hypothetical protein
MLFFVMDEFTAVQPERPGEALHFLQGVTLWLLRPLALVVKSPWFMV